MFHGVNRASLRSGQNLAPTQCFMCQAFPQDFCLIKGIYWLQGFKLYDPRFSVCTLTFELFLFEAMHT